VLGSAVVPERRPYIVWRYATGRKGESSRVAVPPARFIRAVNAADSGPTERGGVYSASERRRRHGRALRPPAPNRLLFLSNV